MPKQRPGRRKPPADLSDELDAELCSFEKRMKEAVLASSAGKRRTESLWEVAKVNWQRTRFVYDLHRSGKVSQDVVDYCVECQLIDQALMARWSIAGYERLCCLQCAQGKTHQHGTACVCRVPERLRKAAPGPCAACGCTGCCSGSNKGGGKGKPDPEGKVAADPPADRDPEE